MSKLDNFLPQFCAEGIIVMCNIDDKSIEIFLFFRYCESGPQINITSVVQPLH